MAIPKEELEATMQPMVKEGKIKARHFGESCTMRFKISTFPEIFAKESE